MKLKGHIALVVEPSTALTTPTKRRWPIEIIGNTGTALMCAGALSLLTLGDPDIGGPLFIAGTSCLFVAAVANEIFGGAL
jgi:hypothetical protein